MEGGIYRHYKGGIYEVIGVARYSEDPDKFFVVYKQLYESSLEDERKLEYGTLWIRPQDMFLEDVEINNEKVPRFKRMR